jgi:hypothetical protein
LLRIYPDTGNIRKGYGIAWYRSFGRIVPRSVVLRSGRRQASYAIVLFTDGLMGSRTPPALEAIATSGESGKQDPSVFNPDH